MKRLTRKYPSLKAEYESECSQCKFATITIIFSIMFSTVLSAQQPDYDIAWKEYSSGRYEEALTAIEQCITHDTTNYRYFFLKGRTLENLYRYDEAITVQQKALQLNSDGKEAQSALASLYLISGQPELSAIFYEKLTIAEPSVTRWKISLATALISSGKYQNALEKLKIVEQSDTTNWLVYKYMGDCYYRLDSLSRTYDSYYHALTIYPHNKSLYGTLTRLLVANDETEAAITIGNDAVSNDSTNLDAWKYLGIAYYKLGDARRAYNALEKAIVLGDSTFTAFSHYGIINYHLSFYSRAEKYLEKARQLDPKDITTMNYLASTYGYIGKAKKGLDVLSELDAMIASFDSIGMKSNIQRGYLLRLLNRNNEAANAYIAATKDFPKDFRNFYEVAICYDAMRNSKKQALEWYARYLEKIDPQWETRQWTEQELKNNELASHAMNRIKSLKTDLFFEESRKR